MVARRVTVRHRGVSIGKLFPNYGESPQRRHVAGICLQKLDLCKLLIPEISACGESY